ncbi:MAG: flavodoxin domain-containing protein, partial [Geminicoccaceae bacterium]
MAAALPLLPESAPFAPEHIEALNAVMARTSAEQRQWLSGFLAGYHAATAGAPLAVPAAAAAPRARIPLTILYGTESGNAEGIGADLKKAAAKQGFAAKLLDMAEASPAEIAGEANLLVVASTWGEGDPPERAAEFYAALMAEDAPRFEGVRFAVLALGDSSYVNFCEVGRRLDARLEALGGERIAPRVDCDLDYETPAATWSGSALEELARRAEPEAGPAGRGGDIIHVDFAAPAVASPYAKANPFPAEITESINLNGSRSTKQTIHLELSLEGSG